MKSSFDELETCLDENFPRTLPLFRILILFEDESARDRAKRIHDHLFHHVKDYCRLEAYRWDMKHLNRLEELVESITMADIIMVAGRETSDLPKEIQTALRDGLAARRADGGAFVTLLGRTNIREQRPSNFHLSLQKLAQEYGLNFFPGAFEIPQDEPADGVDSIQERTNRRTPIMNRIFHRNITPIDYGINE